MCCPTFSGWKALQNIKRKSQGHKKVDFVHPHAVKVYNRNMGKVLIV